MNANEIAAYRCGECYKVFTHKRDAELCCHDKKCEDCGGEIENHHMFVCDSCHQKRWDQRARESWDKAKKVKASEYGEPVFYKDDFYYEGVEEFLESEHCEDGVPDWGLWASDKICNTLNADDLVENLEHGDLAYEDYEVDPGAIDEIKAFCDKWNDTHAEATWFQSKVGIVIDEAVK